MRFCHVTFLVKNLDESLHFYQDIIGLSLKRRFAPDPHLEIAFVESGEMEIELICKPAGGDIDIGRDVSLGFEVKSLEETMTFLNQKGIAFGEIMALGPQARCIFISDPNGIRVQLMEYLGQAHTRTSDLNTL